MAAGRAIVLADGAKPSRAGLDQRWPGWDEDLAIVVAADGGAHLATSLGLTLDRWVGDGDSLGPAAIAQLRAAGIRVEIALGDKDESDTELAVLAAVDAGATDITILGALGGPRLDHTLANIALLEHPGVAGHPIRLLDDATRVSLLSPGAPTRLEGQPGDLVSLLPLGEGARGITTEGLRYALRDEDLPVGPARGLSNVRLERVAWVSVREGRILVVESPATLLP